MCQRNGLAVGHARLREGAACGRSKPRRRSASLAGVASKVGITLPDPRAVPSTNVAKGSTGSARVMMTRALLDPADDEVALLEPGAFAPGRDRRPPVARNAALDHCTCLRLLGRPTGRIVAEGPAPPDGAGPAARQFCCGSYQLARPSCSRCGGGLGGLGAADHVGGGVPGLVLEVRGAAREDLVGGADRRIRRSSRQLTNSCASGSSSVTGSVQEREEAGQRVGVELGELGRADPLEEGLRLLGVRGRGVHPDRDVDVVGDVAGVALVRHRGREGAHLEGVGDLRPERRDLPRAGRVDRGAAEGEEVLAVGVGLRLEAVAEVVLPLGDRARTARPTASSVSFCSPAISARRPSSPFQ